MRHVVFFMAICVFVYESAVAAFGLQDACRVYDGLRDKSSVIETEGYVFLAVDWQRQRQSRLNKASELSAIEKALKDYLFSGLSSSEKEKLEYHIPSVRNVCVKDEVCGSRRRRVVAFERQPLESVRKDLQTRFETGHSSFWKRIVFFWQ